MLRLICARSHGLRCNHEDDEAESTARLHEAAVTAAVEPIGGG